MANVENRDNSSEDVGCVEWLKNADDVADDESEIDGDCCAEKQFVEGVDGAREGREEEEIKREKNDIMSVYRCVCVCMHICTYVYVYS